MSPTTPASRWTDLFRRSSVGGPVFALKSSAPETLWQCFFGELDRTGSLKSAHGSLYSPLVEVWPLLDGGVVNVSPPYSFGLRGMWLIGNSALRLLCSRIGLDPPARRLVGEQQVPDLEALEKAWQCQRQDAATMESLRVIVGSIGVGDDLRGAGESAADLWTTWLSQQH